MMTAPRFGRCVLGASVGALMISMGSTWGMEADAATPNFQPVAVDALPQAGRIGGDTYAVAVAGGFAYIGVGSRLIAVDVSDPGGPRATGQALEFPDVIHDIHMTGDRVYLAAGEAGLRLIDASDPVDLVEVGSYATSGNSRGVHVDGVYAYVAAGGGGLRVIDTSDPAAPALVGSTEVEGQALDVFVVGSHAYIAADEGGLRVVDVSRPDAPLEVGVYETSGDAKGVFIVDGYAYVAAAGGGLRVIDVADPTVPREVGADESQFGRRVFVADGSAYLATERNGLWVIDVSSPNTPVVIANHKTVGSAMGVYVVDDYAYVADGVGGLMITSVADEAGGLTIEKGGARLSPLFLPLTVKALSTQ